MYIRIIYAHELTIYICEPALYECFFFEPHQTILHAFSMHIFNLKYSMGDSINSKKILLFFVNKILARNDLGLDKFHISKTPKGCYIHLRKIPYHNSSYV